MSPFLYLYPMWVSWLYWTLKLDSAVLWHLVLITTMVIIIELQISHLSNNYPKTLCALQMQMVLHSYQLSFQGISQDLENECPKLQL